MIITVKNVHKSYGHIKAVNDLSFNVEQSTCFGFLGPNGAGKTTMMKILYGKAMRDTYNKSIVDVFGYDPTSNELNIKYLSGIVPQENNLDNELNVLQNLQVFAKFYGISKKKSFERIDYLLGFMELTDKKFVRINELSGGMKRRLIIARALLNNPRLLILDEPTTGLDPQVRHSIWDKLRQLQKQGITILLTTHYMEEAFQICDWILIMDKGKKILEGKPQTLLDSNMETYVLEVSNKKITEKIHITSDLRKDESHEIAFYYSNNLNNLHSISQKLKPGEYYLRQSNLEDLFLKMTGRDLGKLQ